MCPYGSSTAGCAECQGPTEEVGQVAQLCPSGHGGELTAGRARPHADYTAPLLAEGLFTSTAATTSNAR